MQFNITVSMIKIDDIKNILSSIDYISYITVISLNINYTLFKGNIINKTTYYNYVLNH